MFHVMDRLFVVTDGTVSTRIRIYVNALWLFSVI